MAVTDQAETASGRVNSAGYDRERQFVGQGIHATGVVQSGHRLENGHNSLAPLRQSAFDTVVGLTEGLEHQRYLLALGFGFRGALLDEDWALLRDSGLAHLMAISGLHIGLAIMLGWWCGSLLRNVFGDCPRGIWLPLWLGLCAGMLYAWLAGFTLPTQRALLMSLIALVLLRVRIVWPGWQVLLLILTLSLALDRWPHTAPGFGCPFRLSQSLPLPMQGACG